MADNMTQTAPYPVVLAELVEALAYKPHWRVQLRDMDRDDAGREHGLTFVVTTYCVDSYHPEDVRPVNHYFPVPPATYDRRSWQRWLFDRFVDVETHEVMEFFQIGGERPYAPSHGPGNDPYLVREVGTELDRRTSFRGEVNP
ncbi:MULTISPECIES: hypothetical protein [unclassified Mycobacterium]|uniref:hypothetical protein n=1 Tax=unclassified Mycobacterium TaxID=2642494 RepID=UPI0029C8C4EA|nr:MULTISPECIES: hypothetical protein [unclassified Mycobacterium]